MRLFIALDVSVAFEAKFSLFRASLPSSLQEAVYLPQDLHLTLKFLGPSDPTLLQDLNTELELISVKTPELMLKSDGFILLPSEHPKVLALTVQKNDALMLLQSQIEKLCQQWGFAPESRSFLPHISVLRTKNEAELQGYKQKHFEHSFVANTLALYDSMSSETGARYRILEKYPLKSFRDVAYKKPLA